MVTTDLPPLNATARRLRRLAPALLAALVTAGCQTPPAPPAAAALPPPPEHAPEAVAPCGPAVEPRDLAMRHVVAYQDKLAALPPAAVAQEAARPVDANASPQVLVDVAMALGATRQPGDVARAMSLLDQVVRNPAPEADAWRGVARLLAFRYAEQHRAEDAAERTAQLLRDTQRDNQRKLDQLNDKLEALKAIERSLSTRPATPAVPPKRPGPRPPANP